MAMLNNQKVIKILSFQVFQVFTEGVNYVQTWTSWSYSLCSMDFSHLEGQGYVLSKLSHISLDQIWGFPYNGNSQSNMDDLGVPLF